MLTRRSRRQARSVAGQGAWRCDGSPGLTSAQARWPSRLAFWGRVAGPAADHGQDAEGQHHQRDVPVPAMPGAGLVVIEADLVLGGLERVLDRPAPPLDGHQGLDRRADRTPGREVGEHEKAEGSGVGGDYAEADLHHVLRCSRRAYYRTAQCPEIPNFPLRLGGQCRRCSRLPRAKSNEL